MKAMVLAAGRGIRMLPLTLLTPKVLLPIQGQPLIASTLLALRRAGIQEVVINLSHLGQQIAQSLGNGSMFGLKLHYSSERKLLGTGGGIKHALPLLGDDPFIVVSGDIWSDYPLHQLPSQPEGLAHLVLVGNPSWHPAGDFSWVDGKVGLGDAHRLTYSNIGVIDPKIFQDWSQEKFEFGDVLRSAAAKNCVTGEYYQGLWFNVGTTGDLDALRSHLQTSTES